jgi:hypothetical protein
VEVETIPKQTLPVEMVEQTQVEEAVEVRTTQLDPKVAMAVLV